MASTKKKKQDNTGTWIAVGVGAGVLLLLIIIGVVTIIVVSNAEEPQAKGPRFEPPPAKPQPPPEKKPPPKDIGEGKRVTDSIRARADRPGRLNELRQIGLFYAQYRDTFNKPPRNVQDFVEFIKRNAPQIKKAFEEKYYFLVVNVRDNGIVAYEFDPDTQGRHGVAEMGGRSHDDMTTDELVAALKAQGSQ